MLSDSFSSSYLNTIRINDMELNSPNSKNAPFAVKAHIDYFDGNFGSYDKNVSNDDDQATCSGYNTFIDFTDSENTRLLQRNYDEQINSYDDNKKSNNAFMSCENDVENIECSMAHGIQINKNSTSLISQSNSNDNSDGDNNVHNCERNKQKLTTNDLTMLTFVYESSPSLSSSSSSLSSSVPITNNRITDYSSLLQNESISSPLSHRPLSMINNLIKFSFKIDNLFNYFLFSIKKI